MNRMWKAISAGGGTLPVGAIWIGLAFVLRCGLLWTVVTTPIVLLIWAVGFWTPPPFVRQGAGYVIAPMADTESEAAPPTPLPAIPPCRPNFAEHTRRARHPR